MKQLYPLKSCIRWICVLGFLLFQTVIDARSQDHEIQQLLLNVEKLEQMKETLVQMKEKYQILQEGYFRLKSVTEGNFQLHELFLNGLYQVNPKVRSYYRVGEIIEMQVKLLRFTKRELISFKQHSGSRLTDISYLAEVFERLQGLSLRNLEELILLITDGQFQMDDAERVQAIDRLYGDMKSLLVNGEKVTSELKQLYQVRAMKGSSLKTIQQILGSHGQ